LDGPVYRALKYRIACSRLDELIKRHRDSLERL
jgi:hypothetical protein